MEKRLFDDILLIKQVKLIKEISSKMPSITSTDSFIERSLQLLETAPSTVCLIVISLYRQTDRQQTDRH